MARPDAVYDLFHVVSSQNVGEFVKLVNNHTKCGWVLRGDVFIVEKKYNQVLTKLSNDAGWAGADD